MDKSKLNLQLTNDALFKDYYSKPENLCIFLSLLLDTTITKEEITYSNNEISTGILTKTPRMDVRITLITDHNYDIDLEMQNTTNNDLSYRMMYYPFSMFVESAKRGNSYYINNRILCVWILNTDNDSFMDDAWIKTYKIQTDNLDELIPNGFSIMIIDLKKLQSCDNIVLREYLSMLESKKAIESNLDSNNEILRKVALSMQKYSESDIAAFIAEQELIARLEENYKINGARQEGHAEGHAEGLVEGKEQTQINNIQNMLKLGLTDEKIKELLNVDDELIIKAKANM